MLRLREKLKYMFLVGLLAFAGFMFGNMNNDTKAELGSDTIDELTVRGGFSWERRCCLRHRQR